MGVSSRVLGERAKGNPNFFVSLLVTSDGRFLPQTGAVLIKDAAGQTLGAVGASGGSGDEDEAIWVLRWTPDRPRRKRLLGQSSSPSALKLSNILLLSIQRQGHGKAAHPLFFTPSGTPGSLRLHSSWA